MFVLAQAWGASAQFSDLVDGNLIQFTDNGAWSWYQDERAVVDTSNDWLFVGSIANQSGVGGAAVDGHIHATRFDLTTGIRTSAFLADIESYGAGDDHNVPAFLIKQDGDLLAFYTGHNNINGSEDYRSFYRTYDTDTQAWGPQSQYAWSSVIPGNAPGSGGTTYSNVFQLADEDDDGDGNGRIYNIARTQQSPHLMYSDDNGATWQYGGQFTKQASNPPASSYVNGYYKYYSNGVDRIDVIATEFHPRDSNTSIYHAYIQDGKLYRSDGTEIDGDLFDAANSFNASNVTSTDDFTNVFQAGVTENSRAWNTDVQAYDDGTISALFKARDGGFGSHTTGANNHNVWLARFDPVTQVWTSHEVARAGGQLFSGNETDYTGLGALDPNDPNTLYLSTEINPINNQSTAHHEIYKGVTEDNGATWTWTAITQDSTYDNLRPVIPQWDSPNTALLWWRGTMSRSQSYDTAVIGLVIRPNEQLGLVRYVDATASNTVQANGASLDATTGTGKGDADGRWHIRTGFGNGSSMLTADEVGSESVPAIKTTVEDIDPGTYDIFAYFWVADGADWLIQAGLSEDNLMLYRNRGAQHAEASQFETAVLLEEADRDLYRAYLGRVSLLQGDTLDVFVDDYTGIDTTRVWYDGIGYALVTGLPGDANADGAIDEKDLEIILSNYGRTDAGGPLVGDLTGDLAVGPDDLDLVLANWTSTTAPTINIPEPGVATLLVLGLGLSRARR